MSDLTSSSNKVINITEQQSVRTAGVIAENNVIRARNNEAIIKLKDLRSRIQTAVNYLSDARHTVKPVAEEYFSLNKGEQANKNKELIDKIPISIEEIIKRGENLITQINTKINKLNSNLVNKK